MRLTFEAVRQQVRNPRDEMPRFTETLLSEQELSDIYAFLRSLGP